MKNPKKQKRKIQKIEKEKTKKKNKKGKIQKKNQKKRGEKYVEKENLKKKKEKKKNLFSVVLDKIFVFCLYHIPDSQQYVKRGSCRRPILSGLLCLFSFWVSGPFVTSSNLDLEPCLFILLILFYRVLESFCIYSFISYLSVICR